MTSSFSSWHSVAVSIVISFCLMASAGAVYAQSDLQAKEDRLEQSIEMLITADTDSNGILSRSELDTLLTDRFNRIDRNGDGAVKEDDAPRMAKQMFLSRVTPLIESRDANDDGELTYAEFSGQPVENFIAADDDDNGEVELEALIARIRAMAAVTES